MFGTDGNQEAENDNGVNMLAAGGAWETAEDSKPVGCTNGKRRSGAAGLRLSKKIISEEIEAGKPENVKKMTEHIGDLSNLVMVDAGMTEENTNKVVKQEIQEILCPTNVLLNYMSAILRTLWHSLE